MTTLQAIDTSCCEYPRLDICDIVSSLPQQYQKSSNLQKILQVFADQINCIYESLENDCILLDCTQLSGDALTNFGERVGFPRCQCNIFCRQGGVACIEDDELYCRMLESYLLKRQGSTTANLCEAVRCLFGGDAFIISSTGGVTKVATGRALTEEELCFIPAFEKVLPKTCGTSIEIYNISDLSNIIGVNCGDCNVFAETCSGATTLCAPLTCNDCPQPPNIICGGVLTSIITNRYYSAAVSSTGGTPDSWTINPALPAGLTFDQTNGSIFGTPTAILPATTYTITATNLSGSDSCEFELEINVDTPSITCPPDRVLTVGVNDLFFASNTGGIIDNGGWGVIPALPAGMVLNTNTGVISGTPTTVIPNQTYIITASNANGFDSCNMNIEVVSATTPCVGSISGSGETNFDGVTVYSGVGVLPILPITSIGSTSGNISGVEIFDMFINDNSNEIFVRLNQSVPSNWLTFELTDGVNNYTMDLTPYVGLTSFSFVGANSATFENIVDGAFTVTATCA